MAIFERNMASFLELFCWMMVCLVLEVGAMNFTRPHLGNQTGPGTTFPPLNGTMCNITNPPSKQCDPVDLPPDIVNLFPVVYVADRQTVNVTCPQNFTLIGPSVIACVDGVWFPPVGTLHCAAPCTNWTPSLNMFLQPPLFPEDVVHHGAVFVTHCRPERADRGGPFIPDPTFVQGTRGELLCYDGSWYHHNQPDCDVQSPTIPPTVPSTTVEENNCSVDDTITNTTSSLTPEDAAFSAPVVYGLSAAVGLLVLILIIVTICHYRLRRNKSNGKPMKKSGFRDQLSIFQKPTPQNHPPKLPERPTTVGSVGSLRYQEYEQPKLPGQKIAEEDAQAIKIDAIRSEIYEQFGKGKDFPEYIDIYQAIK